MADSLINIDSLRDMAKIAGYNLVRIRVPKKSGRKATLHDKDPSELTKTQLAKLKYRQKNKEQIKAYQDNYNKKYAEKRKASKEENKEENIVSDYVSNIVSDGAKITQSDTVDLYELD